MLGRQFFLYDFILAASSVNWEIFQKHLVRKTYYYYESSTIRPIELIVFSTRLMSATITFSYILRYETNLLTIRDES